MNPKHRIAVVDDNGPQRTILHRLLGEDYAVREFVCGEALLESDLAFDAILLDIEMPGLNGYDCCRQLRIWPEGSEIPVIFVSAHDTPPERVAAYEAGGDDFVTKPIAADELRYKVRSALDHRLRLKELAAQSSTARHVAFTAMSSMSDLAVVIAFLRRSTSATSHDQIAAEVIQAMVAWGLKGAVQVRGRTTGLDRSTAGQLSPLQSSVLETLRNIGRIFELGSRAVINFEHVSLLVENLPIQDPEKVGRLRDHLAILAESADMRIASLDAGSDRKARQADIGAALNELRNALQRVAAHVGSNRRSGQQNLIEVIDRLGRTLGTLGLSASQAAYIEDLVREARDETYHFFDQATELEGEFGEVLARLERLSAPDTPQ